MHWADGAQRFETWENSYVNVVGLAATDGVTTHDLGRDRCAIVTAKVANVDSATVAEALAAQQINVSTTVAEHNQFDTHGVHPLVRLSPHYYNTEEEIDKAVEVVAALAR